MTAFVLDNSVVMRWCFENTTTPYAESVLQALSGGSTGVAPILWLYEAGAVLAKAQKSGTISRQKTEEFFEMLQSLPISIDREGTDLILTDVQRLAVTYGLTGYDAVYLELALRKNLPLAKLDDELGTACVKAGGILFAA